MKTMAGVFFLIAGLGPGVCAAQTAKAMFNATISVGWEGHVRTMEWTPIEIMISSQYEEPFIGNLEVSMSQDTHHRLVLYKPMVIQPAQTVRVPMVSKMSQSSDQCRIRMIGRDGRVYLDQFNDLMNYRSGSLGLDMVDASQTFIGVSGKTGVAFDFEEINKEKEHIIACRMFTPMLPHAWVGYLGLDVLVLNDPDYSQMSRAQLQALSQWLSNGGKMILVMGAKALPAESDLGRLLALKIEPPRSMLISQQSRRTWQVQETQASATISGWGVDPKSLSPDWRIAVRDRRGHPLILEGRVGFGKIRLLTFDPQSLAWRDEKASRNFWLGQLGHMIDLEKLKMQANQPPNAWQGPYTQTLADAGQSSVLGYLVRISGLRPVGIWTVLTVLGVMALLIGPVDYLVLKKLNKLPWTYLTFFTVLAIFTAGAYFGVPYWRAGENQMRRLSFVDRIEGASCCWQTGFTSLFASKSDDYVMTGSTPLSWWSGLGVINENWRGSRSTILSNVVCTQQEGNIPMSLPINIWSVRTLTDQEPIAEEACMISGKVTFDDGRISAEVTNHGDSPIEQGMVRVKAGWVRFSEPIGPGETRRVEGPVETDANNEWIQPEYDAQNSYRYYWGDVYTHWLVLSARGVLPRTQGIEDRLARGDAVIYAVSTEGNSCPVQCKDKPVKTTSKTYYRLVIPHVQKLQTGSQS